MEVQWCSEHGLPHSHLLAWDQSDRAKLQAFLLEQSERCQMCGTAAREWDEARKAEEPAPYTPEIHICPGCHMKEAVVEGDDYVAGRQVNLVPRAVAQARAEEAVRRRRAANAANLRPSLADEAMFDGVPL